MQPELDPIFELNKSLPATIHSVAIATRTPTTGLHQQDAKYMPDYGGILEVPGSHLKNNSLNSGPPFRRRPASELVKESHGQILTPIKATGESCIAITNHLDCNDNNKIFSVIRTIGKHLFIDKLRKSRRGYYRASNYVNIPYADNINSIKYLDELQDILIVNFDQGVKTLRLNGSFEVYPSTQETGHDSSQDELPSENAALDFISSIPERSEGRVKDSCLNRLNKTIQSVATDESESLSVKIYDLNLSQSQPFHVLKWPNDDNGYITSDSRSDLLIFRKTRRFQPVKQIKHGFQQIDQIPSHLVNLFATTAQQTLLIDPRCESPSQTLVDKNKIDSFYPVELIKTAVFSSNNQFQFYSVSNVHVRVFDTRYPMSPMNQVNHMLGSESFEKIESKLVTSIDNNIETLCTSLEGRLSFCTFDHSNASNWVNPRSLHPPIHDPSPINDCNDCEIGKLTGFAVRQCKERLANGCLFSVLNLLNNQICMRHYDEPDNDATQEYQYDSQATVISSQKYLWRPKRKSTEDEDGGNEDSGDETDIISQSYTQESLSVEDEEEEEDPAVPSRFINLFEEDGIANFEDRFTSRRAIERFNKMREKLRKR